MVWAWVWAELVKNSSNKNVPNKDGQKKKKVPNKNFAKMNDGPNKDVLKKKDVPKKNVPNKILKKRRTFHKRRMSDSPMPCSS